MNRIEELQEIEKEIDIKLKLYDKLLSVKDWENASKELDNIEELVDKLDSNEIKIESVNITKPIDAMS